MNALQALTDVDRDAVVEWLRDCAVDARHDEQDVGIFGNERMAAAFDELAEIVAAQVDTLPKGRDAKQGSGSADQRRCRRQSPHNPL